MERKCIELIGCELEKDKLDLMTMPREQRDAYIRHCHDEASYVYTRQVEQRIAREEGRAEAFLFSLASLH